jgi:hypothetical protein
MKVSTQWPMTNGHIKVTKNKTRWPLSEKVEKMSMRPENQKGALGFILLKIKRFFLTLTEIQANVALA